ncbi:Protein FAR1-RELATED SEQUENCE 5, partial [Bienertia sinuspersici]
MQESGLRPMESYRYMITEAGGEDCIGHTIIDHLNYCNRLKMKPIEGGDAQAVIDKLYQNMSDDMEFFFRVRVDSYGRVSNIFWRDSMMNEDYNIYGDVTIFDTTYRTNRNGIVVLPCNQDIAWEFSERIPEKYILSRWTKFAKKEVWDKVEAEKKEQGIINNYTPWRLHMARKFYNLILKSHTNEQARKIMEDSYTANLLAIDALLSVESTEQIEEDMEQENSESSTTTVLDPARSKTKGRNKRKKGHYDKHKNKKKKKKKKSITTTTTNNSNKQGSLEQTHQSICSDIFEK